MKIKKYLYNQQKNNVKKNILFSFDPTTGFVSLERKVDASPVVNDLKNNVDAPQIASI